MRYALNTTLPNSLVQLGVDPNIGGAHGFLRESDDSLDAAGCTLLESLPVDVFVEVDGVLAGHDILESRALLATGLQQ